MADETFVLSIIFKYLLLDGTTVERFFESSDMDLIFKI